MYLRLRPASYISKTRVKPVSCRVGRAVFQLPLLAPGQHDIDLGARDMYAGTPRDLPAPLSQQAIGDLQNQVLIGMRVNVEGIAGLSSELLDLFTVALANLRRNEAEHNLAPFQANFAQAASVQTSANQVVSGIDLHALRVCSWRRCGLRVGAVTRSVDDQVEAGDRSELQTQLGDLLVRDLG